MENEVKPLSILEARDFFLKCGCDQRTMLDNREMYSRYRATPGVSFDLEQVWKCEYLDQVIENWDSFDNNKKGLKYYEFFIYMNRNYECYERYIYFLLEQLDAAKYMDEDLAYSIIFRYATSTKWASGYGLLCTYGDYADIIYKKVKAVIDRLPSSDRNTRAMEYNEATYKYIKSEDYINDCQKYNGKKVVVP